MYGEEKHVYEDNLCLPAFEKTVCALVSDIFESFSQFHTAISNEIPFLYTTFLWRTTPIVR
jgi:hypothetical protein